MPPRKQPAATAVAPQPSPAVSTPQIPPVNVVTAQLPTPLPQGVVASTQPSEAVLVPAMPEAAGRGKRARAPARKKPLPTEALAESMDSEAGPAPQQEDGDSDAELAEDLGGKRRKPQLEFTQIDGDDTAYRVRHSWTDEEVRFLKKGMKKFADDPNRWSRILATYPFPPYRTSVDLKDKWRLIGDPAAPKRRGWKEHPITHFELVGTNQRFSNRFPRDAALKAATKGYVYILIRRQKEERVHMYRGSVLMEEPPNIPKFAQKGESVSELIKVPHVQKIQVVANIEVLPEASRISR